MAEYIDREVFISKLRKVYCNNCARRKGMKTAKSVLFMRLVMLRAVLAE